MQPGRPIFLERESYLRRRLRDAAVLAPVLGLVLFLMPMLWAGTGSTAGGLVYLFSAWAVLIVVMRLLSYKLSKSESKPEDPAPEADDAL